MGKSGIEYPQTTPMSSNHSQNSANEQFQDFANTHQEQTKFEPRKRNWFEPPRSAVNAPTTDPCLYLKQNRKNKNGKIVMYYTLLGRLTSLHLPIPLPNLLAQFCFNNNNKKNKHNNQTELSVRRLQSADDSKSKKTFISAALPSLTITTQRLRRITSYNFSRRDLSRDINDH